MPGMPAIVHLPQDHETTAATTFPQHTGITRTFHERTNQPSSTAQRGNPLQSLLFFPVLFITPRFPSASLEDVVPSTCFTQTYNLFPPIPTSLHKKQTLKWHLGIWFCGGLGSARLMIGLNYFREKKNYFFPA